MQRDDFRPGPLADVDRVPVDDRWDLVLVRELRHPPEKVWAALTDPGQLAQWAPFLADRDLGRPGEAMLSTVDGDRTHPAPATVLRADRPIVLEHTWGDGLLRWDLDRTGAGTTLTLRHRIDRPDLAPMVAAGWHLCLDVAGHLLDGDPVGPIRGAEAKDFGWAELRDAYAERLDRR
ncbi:SRPBCC family protein [Micromonospora sp. WMMC241]|uniref:SRPBCC family protein n=1 Tax=Micromonospora sp. WMMC241 TaxID=3015159 RepID=UPI0022B6D33E|nr:SRPBCC family protein [Micromonospora sp. WMMC241]MCZ7436078.1 SRPBCC family protein [Micromonospora sp. WMMC241]